MAGSVISPTARVGMPASRRMRSANGTWYPGTIVTFWLGLMPPPEAQTKAMPASRKARATTTDLVRIEAALDPIGPRQAGADDHRRRQGGAHRAGDLEQEAHAVRERTAIIVVTPVGERRQEFVEEIAVGAVDLDIVEAGPLGALCRRDEGGRDRGDPVAVERRRHMPAVGIGDGRGGDRLPGIVAPAEGRAALPRPVDGSLAPGMGELDAEAGARPRQPPRRGERACRRRLVAVAVKTEAAMGDAAAPFDAGRLDR